MSPSPWTGKPSPISPDGLVTELADRIVRFPTDTWTRVAVDGAPVARPADLAAALVDPLRVRGRPALAVAAGDFLRPASLRLERGREDPDELYERWLDTGALAREVLDPLGPGGSGRVLPSLWDAARDRATRADYVTLPPGGVLLLSGALLLGRGLTFDFAVHLWLSPAALARRGEAEWALPAYARYEREVAPARTAAVVVRADDPDHPAVIWN
jgi:hypothetical protein